MADQLGLFGDDPPPAARAVGAAEPTAEARAAAAAIPPTVRLGTSSWSFPGWTGLVWDREVSKQILAREGLRAYAEHPLLRTVGLDRTYYRSISAGDFRDYADQVPDDFRFLVKADRLVTSPLDPESRGVRERNPRFLDAAWTTEAVVEPMTRGLGPTAGPLLFQFSPFPASLVGGPEAFAEALGHFLAALPRGPLYAVELRTPALLTPAYVQALEEADAVHGHTVHPAMAPLEDQLRAFPPSRGRALVLRWMLHAGLRYEAARDRYEPFHRLVDEDVPSREGIAAAVKAALEAGREAFVVVNNKAEGSSPLSVARLAERVAGRSRPTSGPGAEREASVLRWIVGLLRRHGARFQAAGGLAARAWGATRPLADLDFYVARDDLRRVLPEVEPWVTRPLGPVDEAGWRMRFMRLEKDGVAVELGEAEDVQIRNATTGELEPQDIDPTRSVERTVLGLLVPVMPRAELLAYKAVLDREVDRRDRLEVEEAVGGRPEGP